MLHCLGGKDRARSPTGNRRMNAGATCPTTKPILELGITGSVKWFNVKNGYGFITRHDNGHDVFVHNTAIAAFGSVGKGRWRGLADGEAVQFDVVIGKKGLEAANVTGPNGGPVRGSVFARDRPRHRKSRSDKERWGGYNPAVERLPHHHQESNNNLRNLDGAQATPSSPPRHSERKYLSRRRPLLQGGDRSSSESETGTSPSRCSDASTDSSSSDVGSSDKKRAGFYSACHGSAGDGLISEEEFFVFMNEFSDEDNVMEELLAAFKVFDKDGNGFITKEELKRAMEMIGEDLTDKALDELLSSADINRDGKIDYSEFAKMLL